MYRLRIIRVIFLIALFMKLKINNDGTKKMLKRKYFKYLLAINIFAYSGMLCCSTNVNPGRTGDNKPKESISPVTNSSKDNFKNGNVAFVASQESGNDGIKSLEQY